MSNGKLWTLLIVTASAAVVISMLPDIKRYVRISTM
jgi:hypothetical protein